MKTVEETLELCAGDGGHDPLHGSDPEDMARVHPNHELGLVYLQGTAEAETNPSGGEYADDLLIVLHHAGWTLFWRDPEGVTEPTWGRTWFGGKIYWNWSDLVGQAYSL